MSIEFEEEFVIVFDSLSYEYKTLLIKYFHEDYIDFEYCYNCENYSVGLKGVGYNSIDTTIKNKINNLIKYRDSKKKEIIGEFMDLVNRMKELFIEPPDEFNLTYHITYHADRSGQGYLVVPYLNKQVAEITTDNKQQDWSGKYGSTITNSIEECGGYISLDCNSETPGKPYGIALEHNQY